MTKVFTVFGATGQQGGSVIRSVQANPTLRDQYTLRAVTRNPSSESSSKLKSSGVQVVKADLNDPASIKEAVAGSSVVFGVTNYWDPSTGDSETAQGKAIADAAAATGAEFFIWSSLPGKKQIDKASGGKSNIRAVPHFDTKAAVEEYVQTKLPKLPAAFVHAAFFLENFLTPLIQPTDGPDGSLVVRAPLDPVRAKVPLYTPTDMGTYVTALLLAPRDSVVGKQWFALSDLLSPNEIVEAIGKAKGKKVTFEQVSLDTYKTFLPKDLQDHVAASMELIDNPGYFGSEKIANDALNAYRDLIEKTKAGKLTTAAEYFKAAYKK